MGMDMKLIAIILVVLLAIYAVKIYAPKAFNAGDGFLTDVFSQFFEGIKNFFRNQIQPAPPPINETGGG